MKFPWDYLIISCTKLELSFCQLNLNIVLYWFVSYIYFLHSFYILRHFELHVERFHTNKLALHYVCFVIDFI